MKMRIYLMCSLFAEIPTSIKDSSRKLCRARALLWVEFFHPPDLDTHALMFKKINFHSQCKQAESQIFHVFCLSSELNEGSSRTNFEARSGRGEVRKKKLFRCRLYFSQSCVLCVFYIFFDGQTEKMISDCSFSTDCVV